MISKRGPKVRSRLCESQRGSTKEVSFFTLMFGAFKSAEIVIHLGQNLQPSILEQEFKVWESQIP